MISFNTFFKQKMTRFFIIVFSALLIIFNIGFFVFSIVQYNRQIERQEDSFIEMMGHLIVLESIDASITYVEHYDHTHGVSVIYYDADNHILYQSEQIPNHTNRLQIKDSSDNILGEVVLDYQKSVIGKELTVGLVSFNLFSLIVFLIGISILYKYINSQYKFIVEDMNNIGKGSSSFKFSDIDNIHDRYIKALESEKEIKKIQEHYVKVLAHDVKTPLTVIKAYLEGIHSKRIEFDSRINQDMLNEVKIIEKLIPQLMVTSIKQVSIKQDIALPIKATLDKLKDVFKTKDIEVYQSIDSFIIYVSTIDIVRLLENLVFNAFYYSDYGGKINIVLDKKNSQLVVEDFGIGMSKETLNKIYSGPYRETKAKQYHQKGSGVGLQIVFAIVEKIGAKIRIDSEENKGTRVTITFSSD
ncbi:MAG: HAMP domain-containing histidine kinase [Tenericutes bacterium]|nr:HAMP domain-containing histidine kinase [Mycoplasmatota bacterium]